MKRSETSVQSVHICQSWWREGIHGSSILSVICYLWYISWKRWEGVRFSGWSNEYGFVNEENTGVQTVSQTMRLLIELLLSFMRYVFPCLHVHHFHPLAAQYTLLDSDKWGRRKPVFPGTLFLVGMCVWLEFTCQDYRNKRYFQIVIVWIFRRSWSSGLSWSTEVANQVGELYIYISKRRIEIEQLPKLWQPRLSNVSFFTFAWNISVTCGFTSYLSLLQGFHGLL